MIEFAYLFRVCFHKYVISHLENGQGSTQKEPFDPVYVILIVQFGADSLLRETLEDLILHVPVDDRAFKEAKKEGLGLD